MKFKRIKNQNERTFETPCMANMKLEMMFGDVFEWWEGHFDHMWRFSVYEVSYHYEASFRAWNWFPGPPLTLLLESEGITLRLDSAKHYQKPFRRSH